MRRGTEYVVRQTFGGLIPRVRNASMTVLFAQQAGGVSIHGSSARSARSTVRRRAQRFRVPTTTAKLSSKSGSTLSPSFWIDESFETRVNTKSRFLPHSSRNSIDGDDRRSR